MSSDTPTVNPYQPPNPVNERVSSAVRSFKVGDKEITTVFVKASLWKGIQTYTGDVDRPADLIHRGTCQFEVGENERHDIRIDVDGNIKVNIYVDGQLIGSNLFERLRIRIFMIVAIFIILTIVLAFGLMALILAWFLKPLSP